MESGGTYACVADGCVVCSLKVSQYCGDLLRAVIASHADSKRNFFAKYIEAFPPIGKRANDVGSYEKREGCAIEYSVQLGQCVANGKTLRCKVQHTEGANLARRSFEQGDPVRDIGGVMLVSRSTLS